MKDIAIYGAGGFGREVLALIQNINKVSDEWNIVGFFDDGCAKGESHNGVEILGGVDELNAWPTEIAVAVTIGSPDTRKDVVGRIHNPNVYFPTLIHPSVLIGDRNYVEIGKGCIICAANIITTNVKIGNFVILNLACTVGHDSVLGDFSAYMPSVNISGDVVTGECVYVGTGAKIINQVKIGENTIVGAGAVVAKSLPANCTAVGVPAKVLEK